MDLVRSKLGDRKLNYLGFSYGTFVGATYASLFPNRYRAMVLDGPLDANGYINRPMQGLREQSAGFERALGRFFQACAADQGACLGFGGSDPWGAYDELIDARQRVTAPGDRLHARSAAGRRRRRARRAVIPMYAKQLWPLLAEALALAQAGDGTLIRALTDEFFYGRDPDTGAFDPGSDRYFTIGASEQRYRRDIGLLPRGRRRRVGTVRPLRTGTSGTSSSTTACGRSATATPINGPFRASRSAPTPLVVADEVRPRDARTAARCASSASSGRPAC